VLAQNGGSGKRMKKLHNYELYAIFSLPCDVREMKTMAVPWAALSL
jgi:hypothetical protein